MLIKMEQRDISDYKGFTVSMALVDMIPVILFGIGGMIVFGRIGSPLFGVGIFLSTVGGGCKAAWKLIIALRHRDIALLPKLFHALLPSGFALMLLSVPFSLEAWGMFMKTLLVMPPLAPLVVGCIGMALKGVFAVKLDGKDPRANWIEQLTNLTAQGMFIAALLLA